MLDGMKDVVTRGRNRMHRISRLRPTTALIVASIALLVALAGTSAAAVALVPKNSVGSDQVIDGSLRSRDFKGDQVLAVDDVVSRSIDGPIAASADSFTTIATLPITKPGAYLIWSTARVESNNLGGECRLGAGGNLDRSQSQASPATLWNVVVHGFGSPGTVELQCGGIAKGPSQVRDIKLKAIRIAGS
jgi:hypothetical protein